MKKSIYAILLVLIFSACNKDDEYDGITFSTRWSDFGLRDRPALKKIHGAKKIAGPKKIVTPLFFFVPSSFFWDP